MTAFIISKPYPRKGTETDITANEFRSRPRISKPYPRKGTETVAVAPVIRRSRHRFQNHIPARGRKRLMKFTLITFFMISKPYPRKGTETSIFVCIRENLRKNFKTISPQGDGNHVVCIGNGDIDLYFKTISPQGDGNYVDRKGSLIPSSHFKTISPQGDGNNYESPWYSFLL